MSNFSSEMDKRWASLFQAQWAKIGSCSVPSQQWKLTTFWAMLVQWWKSFNFSFCQHSWEHTWNILSRFGHHLLFSHQPSPRWMLINWNIFIEGPPKQLKSEACVLREETEGMELVHTGEDVSRGKETLMAAFRYRRGRNQENRVRLFTEVFGQKIRNSIGKSR